MPIGDTASRPPQSQSDLWRFGGRISWENRAQFTLITVYLSSSMIESSFPCVVKLVDLQFSLDVIEHEQILKGLDYSDIVTVVR